MGIGDWVLGPIPNPQSPIPNPQSPFKEKNIYNIYIKLYNFFKIKTDKLYKILHNLNIYKTLINYEY